MIDAPLPTCRYRHQIAGTLRCLSSCVEILDPDHLERACAVCPLPDKDCSEPTVSPVPRSGPGSELVKITHRLGVPPCEQCYELARQMDSWGAAGCRARLDEIVSAILPRARRWAMRGWLTRYATDRMLRFAVRHVVLEAIRRAERTAPPRADAS